MEQRAIRIRMYRVGFGDCFLVSLPVQTDGRLEQRHILVDCGVHSMGSLKNLPRVVEHIGEVTDRKLALVVASHAHQDHIAGFGQCAEQFARFDIEEVWLPWTENPEDRQAIELRRKQAALTQQLARHFAALGPAGADARAADAAIVNLTGNEKALQQLRSGFGSGARVRYLTAGKRLVSPGHVPGLTVRVLGPPRDEAFLARMNPPAGQRFLSADDEDAADRVEPFAEGWTRTVAQVEESSEFKGVRLSEAERKRLMYELTDPSLGSLAFALDQVRNNTSLVLAFVFRGQLLLFPGDAQYGNWQWWLKNMDADDILSSVSFFKVGHHGSHNASPRDAIERLSGRFAAMVSTQSEPWDSIPRLPLLERLEELTGGRVVRSDSLALADRPDAPKGPVITELAEGFAQGELWYDYSIPL